MTDHRLEIGKLMTIAWEQQGKPSMRSLAAESDLAVSTIHSVITGRSLPTAETLTKVLDLLKVTGPMREGVLAVHNLSTERKPTSMLGAAYLVLKDGEVHDVVINDEPMARKQAAGEKAVLVKLPILQDFRERE